MRKRFTRIVLRIIGLHSTIFFQFRFPAEAQGPCYFYPLTPTTHEPTCGPSDRPAPHVALFYVEVRCGTAQSDGRIIVGGNFTQITHGSGYSPQVGHIARFTFNGLPDSTQIEYNNVKGRVLPADLHWHPQ